MSLDESRQFKGAFCSFGVEMLMSRERSSLVQKFTSSDWPKLQTAPLTADVENLLQQNEQMNL